MTWQWTRRATQLGTRRSRRARAVSPDHLADAGLDPVWSPTVLRRQQAVDLARAELLGARTRDPDRPLSELLPLARALHEARLEHAAALLTAGGEVPDDLRSELQLRARRAGAGSPAALPRSSEV